MLTVAVTGATGAQGGATARSLLAAGHRVRALTRRPDSPAADTLRALGAEVRCADFDDRTSLDAALAGADSLFAVTAFEAGIEAEVRPGQDPRRRGGGRPPRARRPHLRRPRRPRHRRPALREQAAGRGPSPRLRHAVDGDRPGGLHGQLHRWLDRRRAPRGNLRLADAGRPPAHPHLLAGHRRVRRVRPRAPRGLHGPAHRHRLRRAHPRGDDRDPRRRHGPPRLLRGGPARLRPQPVHRPGRDVLVLHHDRSRRRRRRSAPRVPRGRLARFRRLGPESGLGVDTGA
ncbi:hypothetical protein STANM309S_00399 [Streptomyces tanashiensis]